jgi:hypothetical protein
MVVDGFDESLMNDDLRGHCIGWIGKISLSLLLGCGKYLKAWVGA